MSLVSELSVFIDESGDFGELTERPAYYLVTLVFQISQSIFILLIKKKNTEAL